MYYIHLIYILNYSEIYLKNSINKVILSLTYLDD